tara:strand:- start:1528 stop:1836 length:309 start_codon:yes stop_codon:yes gene_type:complete
MANRVKNQQIKVTDGNRKRFYKYIKYPEIPEDISDIYIITRIGERLDLLANKYYQNPDLWWVIMKANPNKLRRDSFFMPVGIQIRIPSNLDFIIRDFENLNK